MVDTNFLNQSIDSKELSGVLSYVSAVPKYLTEQITSFLVNNNFQVTQRFTGLILAFVSLALIFLGIKVLQKVNILIKIILIVLGVVILLGLFVPFW